MKTRLALLALTGLAACTAPTTGPNTPWRIASPVNSSSLATAQAAIAAGAKQIDVGDWSRPDHVGFVSGGDARIGWQIADLLNAHGITARCVGYCGSALAEIVIGARRCSVTANGTLHAHLAWPADPRHAPLGREIELESARQWLEHGLPADIVTRMERSPAGDRSWRLSTQQIRDAGCSVQ